MDILLPQNDSESQRPTAKPYIKNKIKGQGTQHANTNWIIYKDFKEILFLISEIMKLMIEI